MQRRNTRLMISLATLLLVSVALMYFSREAPRTEIDQEHFRLQELEKIDKVELQSVGGKVELTFDGRWRVNGKWDADAQMIKVLFATLKQAVPRRPVAKSLLDSIKKELSKSGVQVKLSSGGVEQMSFIAGGNASKTESWFWKSNEDEVYIMMIPGYRIYLSGILELDEGGWRNKRIFDFNWRNFKSVTATYPKEPDQGFTVELKEGLSVVRGLSSADTTKVNDYLDAVSLLFASRFIPAGMLADSLVKAKPAAQIEILDVANRSYRLSIFTPRKNDPEIFGIMGDSQAVTLDRRAIEPIVRRKNYFSTKLP